METLTVKKDKSSAAKEAVQKLSGSASSTGRFLAEKVETIFGYPGGAIMPIYDALYDYQDKLKHILSAMNRAQSMLHRDMHEHPEKQELYLQQAAPALPIW